MDLILALIVGFAVAVAVWLMMAGNLIRFLIGFGLLGNAVNLLIFQSGRMTYAAPPIVPEGAKVPAGAVANALPQALILTAIVIGFGLVAFTLVLIYRYFGAFGTVEVDEVDLAEPRK